MSESEQEKKFWIMVRQALILFVDAIENYKLHMPRTSKVRKSIRTREYAEKAGLHR